MAYIQGIARNQAIMFPEIIDDYIEEDNPAQFIDAFADSLDLEALDFTHSQPQEVGRPAYAPGDLLKLYLWGYLNRIRSSRWLEKETHRNVEVMWLLGKLMPDFKTIADFRKDNKEAIKKVCREFIFLCKHWELFGGELVSIDGSKFKAVNSKKRNFNQDKLQKRLKEIDEQIETYLKELEDNDNEESCVGRVSAEELKAKIEKLKQRGEDYQELLKRLTDSGERQISLTDPDSRAMRNNQKIEVCYNVQTVVDSKNKLIVDFEVTNEGTDQNQLSTMAERAKEILGVEELEVLADKGYYAGDQIKECVADGIIPYVPEPDIVVPGHQFLNKSNFRYDGQQNAYICPEGKTLTFWNVKESHGKLMNVYRGQECRCCPLKNSCTSSSNGRLIYRWEHEHILEDMRQRVKTNEAKMKMRKQLSEHPFGTMKRAFNQGYLLLKGIEKVRGEISLTVLSYNITRVLNIIGVQAVVARLRQVPAGFSANDKPVEAAAAAKEYAAGFPQKNEKSRSACLAMDNKPFASLFGTLKRWFNNFSVLLESARWKMPESAR